MSKDNPGKKNQFSLSELNLRMVQGAVLTNDELRFFSRAMGALHDRLLKFFGRQMFRSLRRQLESEQRIANSYLLHRGQPTVDIKNLSEEELGADFALVEKMPLVTNASTLELSGKDVSNIERRLQVVLDRLKELNHGMRSADVDVVEHVYLKWVQDFRIRRKVEKSLEE